MKAAIVHAFDQPPRYGDIEAPTAAPGEVLVRVRAAALSQLVRAQASGKHYSSGKQLPLVPGADGVGLLEDGTRVYFCFPRAPIGAMAEIVAVDARNCVPVPDEVDDLTAAAIANPGMSSWAALQERARFQAGERVLVNGAAGASGRLAIQVAKHLGASHVVATARNAAVEAELRGLGADDFICLDQPVEQLTAVFREEIKGRGIDVVLDYLWGQPAACILEALGGPGNGEAAPRVRFVNIGSIAGASIPMNPGVLRGSGLEMSGSGLGSISNAGLAQVVGQLLQAIGSAGLRVEARAVPLAAVEATWGASSAERVVFVV
ncbi:zinc-binding alcohol dehydrogenase family protein [Pseudomonas sp. 148P]|uniref:Zinc-binding alcohol dehydrogenase family protein n=1 Tax=Pseudomonas ulcerans TaxID=3115852 RepID=A0ABU7I1W9_9PSED|nr:MULTISPECIES: zinc-binding alcohol dehydrogenase family protein [unclassified Pseudomonas]MEE1926552.1 zinc-binding alcohol dehydrogenase family protein [Pseudomonas sp. 147P]MEE1937789.1 zinc-binding alcohol dehydrogenase family protein [Pseudomonas sp. 148P]